MAGRARVSGITVVPFRREFAADFRRLNLDWIERLFKVEAPDLKVLDDPEAAIIAKGGAIFFAVEDGAPVGTAAMLRVTDRRFELAKMAVAQTHQRRGVGEMLGRACTDWAARKGPCTVFLETNSRLGNAIRLYERLGFRHVPRPTPTEYARSDVYMEKTMHKSRLAGFIIDCRTDDLQGAARFWSRALGMETEVLPGQEGDSYVKLKVPDERLHIEVQAVDHDSRVHLDIEADDIEAEVQRLEKLGAKRLKQVHTWVVMEAPTGQRFCVVRPQNKGFAQDANVWK
jgi:GNAT superfamily N-acetyltransferase/predicted enzyme related to lactoylglutathione lyase